MSRCFPFPPPGYEKKPRSDDIDFLAKEKRKDKKHKKEKRDKEKREGKERKDKDRSRDKHKENKNRKEKHKEKKRDKDRDKGKSAAADDKKIEERTKGHIEQKLGDGSRKAEEVKNSKFTEEFSRRIKDEGAADRLPENFAGSIQNETEGFGASIASKKDKGNRNEMAANCIAKEPRRDDALGQPVEMDPDKKIEGEEKAKDKYEMLANLISKEQRRNDEMGRAVEKDAEKIVEAKEKVKDRHGMVAYLFCKEQRRDDGMGQPVKKDTNKKIEGKEKAKDDADKKIERKEKVTDREAYVGEGGKLKDRDHKKRPKGQDKDRHKEKEKVGERKREKGEHKHKAHGKTRDSGKMDQIENLIIKPSVPQKDNEKCAGTDGTIKKRKDFEINGFYEIDGLPNKLPRPASSSRLHVENGRTLESYNVAMGYSSVKHETTNNINAERVLDSKECKINGVVGLPPSTVDIRPSVSVFTSQNGKPSVKPPHPDAKFLSQIYSIPKMVEWPEYDNQDWLFHSDPLRPKPKASFKAEEPPQMWAKGQRIESTDVFALPYVIPY
ncbi:RNA-binding protein 25-like [Phoenix dactylifera]|uniref:RNA-binding protein 25-like n=1 Tax=Phoenix dactylifera TaxID=42345 RepID=A0A8B8ZNL5_PHODC|nr:RNA-binding protein 25-like [Phoenix dactylifera]